MVQSVKCWPHKHEDLSFIPGTHMKTPAVVAGSCNPSTREVGMSLLASQSV